MEVRRALGNMEIKNVLITGVDGYIGSVLSELLRKQHLNVYGLDTFYYRGCTLGPYKKSYIKIRSDVRDIDRSDLGTIDAVIHLAALSNDPLGALNPNVTKEVNYAATVRLAKLAKQAGVKRFIFSSSCSIYGIARGTVNENSPVKPLTAYAKSKINAENELKKLTDRNFCVCIMRNSTVYGYSPKFRSDLVVNNMVASAVTTGQIRMMSDGTPWRPLIDVRDLSNIFYQFLTAPAQKVNGKIFNVGFNENNIQIKSIAEEIKRRIPYCVIVYTGEHGKDTRSYKVNFDLFHRVFKNVRQEWPLRKSIADLIAKLKKYKVTKQMVDRGLFARVNRLKNLTVSQKLTSHLYWNDN